MPRKKPQPPEPQVPKAKAPGDRSRCTKTEREYRVRKLLQLAKNGWSVDQLEDFTMHEWGIKREMARKYVNEVLDVCVASISLIDRRRIAALTLLRFENAYRMAVAQRNPAAMVAANAQIAQYWVAQVPEVSVSQSTSDAPDPEEDF